MLKEELWNSKGFLYRLWRGRNAKTRENLHDCFVNASESSLDGISRSGARGDSHRHAEIMQEIERETSMCIKAKG
jgi:hypothetical protein